MSHDQPPTMGRWEKLFVGYMIWIWLAPMLGLVLTFLLYFILAGSGTSTTKKGGDTNPAGESNLEMARQSLARQSDLNTCRSALQQINEELGTNPSLRPPSATKEQTDWLREHAGLDDAELAEAGGSTFTRLDAQHLESCLLLRDAARALELKGARGVRGGAALREPPLDLATRAFAWVVRQVRLHEHSAEVVPPAYVLRRGWGASVERALAFLALLQQLGDLEGLRPELLGCLLFVPGESGGMRLWACGVVAGDDKDIHLFDPRLGLPLPGPDGRGIATLTQACQQPDVLAQLHADKYRYDVTAEQARKARVLLVRPLSALAPRARALQEQLLAPTVRVRLACDAAADLARLKAAGGDRAAPVELWKPAVGLLRRFLPTDEGGTDQGVRVPLAGLRGFTRPDDPTVAVMPRRELFFYELVPWTALPVQFQDNERYPYNIGLGQRVRGIFAQPFITSARDPGQPRDLLLRGRYTSAVPALVLERDRWREQQQQRAAAADLDRRAAEWLDNVTRAYADQLRAATPAQREEAGQQVQRLWSQRAAAPIYLLLNGAIAGARTPEVAHLLGLCMHEQAEQLQARVDVPAKGGSAAHPSDVEKARQGWQDALSAWKQYVEEYPNRSDAPAARRMRARAEAALGDDRAAAAILRDLSEPMTDLEKLAALHLAARLEKKPADKDK